MQITSYFVTMIDPHTLPSIEDIELWRKAHGIKRSEIAALCDVSTSTYEKWCATSSNKEIPPYQQAFMQQHINPRTEALPDRISVDASWEEVQAWSVAFKKSDDPDLQTWMLNKLNEAAEIWASRQPSASVGEQAHRPSGVASAPENGSENDQRAG